MLINRLKRRKKKQKVKTGNGCMVVGWLVVIYSLKYFFVILEIFKTNSFRSSTSIRRLVLVSQLNGISTFVGYLVPKPFL